MRSHGKSIGVHWAPKRGLFKFTLDYKGGSFEFFSSTKGGSFEFASYPKVGLFKFVWDSKDNLSLFKLDCFSLASASTIVLQR